jgi:hypothetical protein
LNSLCAADTDCPARRSSGCQCLNHSERRSRLQIDRLKKSKRAAQVNGS